MRKILLLLLLFLCSCIPHQFSNQNLTRQEMKIYNEWIYSIRIKNFSQLGEVISRPPGVFQFLFSLTIPIEGGLHYKTHCIYYQVPYKKIIGILKIDELKSAMECPVNSDSDSWLEVQNIKDLRISLESFKLHLIFKNNTHQVDWSFLLPNISMGEFHEKNLYPGMSLLRTTEESFKNINNKYLGRISDRNSTNSAIVCMKVDKGCHVVGEDRCDDCRYGWYQVVDFQCPKGGSHFCGQNHCGEKLEPACPRGAKIITDESLGICQNDLTPVWNAAHILICQ